MVSSHLRGYNPQWIENQHRLVWTLNEFYMYYPSRLRWYFRSKEQHFNSLRVYKGKKFVCRWCASKKCNYPIETQNDLLEHLTEICKVENRYAFLSENQYRKQRGLPFNKDGDNLTDDETADQANQANHQLFLDDNEADANDFNDDQEMLTNNQEEFDYAEQMLFDDNVNPASSNDFETSFQHTPNLSETLDKYSLLLNLLQDDNVQLVKIASDEDSGEMFLLRRPNSKKSRIQISHDPDQPLDLSIKKKKKRK